MIFRNLTRSAADIALGRARKLLTWTSWAKELAESEIALRKSMEPGVCDVVRGKKILLMKRIAEDINWTDMSVFDEFCKGFKNVGNQPPSGIFALELRPASFSVEEFDGCAKFIRPALLGKVKSATVDQDLVELFKITQEESRSEQALDGRATFR